MSVFKSIFKRLISKLHIKPVIIFESYPDLSDNTFMVFKELMKRGYNKKFIFVWQLSSKNDSLIDYLKKNKCKYYYLYYSNALEHIKNLYYRYNCDTIICNNAFLSKKHPSQKYFYLSHGVALKNCGDTYHLPPSASDATVLTISEFFYDYDVKNLHCKRENLVPLGFPRNDVLLTGKIDLNQLFSQFDFQKAVCWMPTYRQHRLGRSVSNISIPIIHNDRICEQVNSVAKEKGVLIIIKPHPAQDLSFVRRSDYSNIVFIDNDFLENNNISNYELLASCDALITDYSSVYYDYLLCDKPIGLCWEDFDEYNRNEGFVVDVDFVMSGGEKIYTAEEFCAFINRVADGEDLLKTERNKIKHLTHKYPDADATSRVADYIENNFF